MGSDTAVAADPDRGQHQQIGAGREVISPRRDLAGARAEVGGALAVDHDAELGLADGGGGVEPSPAQAGARDHPQWDDL